MRSAGLCVAFVFAVAAGCGSSGGGGAGGSAGGNAGAGGHAGAGGSAAGAGGSAAGAGGSAAGAGGSAAGAGGSAAGAGGSAAGTSGSAGTGGTGPVACGTDTGTGSGAACSTVTPSGACVTSVRSNVAVPTPAGGTFVVGTYNLTSRTVYGPADAGFSAQTGRETFVVLSSSPTSLTIDEAQSSGTRLARAHGTVAISGMTATFTPSCPAGDAGSGQGGTVEFTATSINFTLFEQQNGLTQMSVYVRAAL